MMVHENFTPKCSEKKMEAEGLRTVECLRGRLLAERAASKAANFQSQHFALKLTELENQLRIEIKSRNKAEKRLKFLMKKLESLNMSSENSSRFSEKSEISSVSSSSSTKGPQDEKDLHETQINNTLKCEIKDSPLELMDPTTFGESQNCPSHEQSLASSDEAISGIPIVNRSQKDGDEDDLKKGDKQWSKSNKIDNVGHEQDANDHVNNSMALVMVDSCEVKGEIINGDDEQVCNGNVKDVLDGVRDARESLQNSMEMTRHMRSNMAQARFNVISC